jgi:hypothetical protein
MITLKFTAAQIRRIIQANPDDRLASLLLDRLLGNPESISSLLVSHLRQNGVKMPPVETNKILWIKELREWSRNNPDILALFEPRLPNSGGPDVLGLAEAKRWLEKPENAAAINALL